MIFRKILFSTILIFVLMMITIPVRCMAQKDVYFHAINVSIKPNKEIITGYFFNTTLNTVTIKKLSINVFITDLLKGTNVFSDHALFNNLSIDVDAHKTKNYVFVINNENFHGYTKQYHWKTSSNIWFVNK